MNIFDIKNDKPKLNIFEVDSKKPTATSSTNSEPVNTPQIDFDLSNTNNVIPGQEFTQNRDTTSTEAVRPAFGLSDDVTSPKYLDNQSMEDIKKEQYEKASISGTPYIDPETGKNTGIPIEPGLEDTSLEALPVGKLGFAAGSSEANTYDFVLSALEDVAKKEGKLSSGARYLRDLNEGIIKPEEFFKKIEDIPKDEQSIIIAEGDELFKNYFKGAIDKNDKAATRLATRFKMRKSVIDQFAASKEDMAKASKEFGEMRKAIKSEVPDSYVTGTIKSDIADLDKVYKTDASPLGTTIRNVLVDVKDEMDVDTALDLVENVNFILRKPSVSKTAKKNLINIKESLNSFIDTALKDRPDLKDLKDKAINNYRQTVNDYKLGELIKKNTTNKFAVNWGKLSSDIKKEGLSSDNISYAKPILEDFEKRFTNDKYLSKLLPASGAGSSNILSLLSEVYSSIIDIGHKILKTDRAHGLTIQKEIRKSLNSSHNKYYEDYINSLIRNPKLPDEIKDEVKLIGYKPEAKLTGDIELTPKYATEQGTVGTDASQVALHDAQTKMVKETLGKGYSDEVVNKTSELLNSKRFKSVIKATSDRLKADDIHGNMKMLQKTIQSETDKLVSRINKDHGVKLPPKEVEKLYRMKLQELLKDCK